MPRKYFDQKLADLNRSMKEMGAWWTGESGKPWRL